MHAARAVYCYILGRQAMPAANTGPATPAMMGAGEPSAAEEALAGCWCVEHVKVLDDPRLIAAIDAAYWPSKKK